MVISDVSESREVASVAACSPRVIECNLKQFDAVSERFSHIHADRGGQAYLDLQKMR